MEKKPQEAPRRTLARSRMLKRAASFQRVYRLGKSYAGRHLVLYVFRVRAGEKKLKGEVGFAAGKKLGCAVERNRVKRRLRAACVPLLPRMKPGLYVFIARQPAAQAEFSRLCRSMQTVLRRQNLLRAEPAPDAPKEGETR